MAANKKSPSSNVSRHVQSCTLGWIMFLLREHLRETLKWTNISLSVFQCCVMHKVYAMETGQVKRITEFPTIEMQSSLRLVPSDWSQGQGSLSIIVQSRIQAGRMTGFSLYQPRGNTQSGPLQFCKCAILYFPCPMWDLLLCPLNIL